jgi:hypothetical protein
MQGRHFKMDSNSFIVAVEKAVKDWKGKVEYADVEKGVIVLNRSSVKMYAGVLLLIDVTPDDKGCSVTILSMMAGQPFVLDSIKRRAENAFIKHLMKYVK